MNLKTDGERAGTGTASGGPGLVFAEYARNPLGYGNAKDYCFRFACHYNGDNFGNVLRHVLGIEA